MVFAVLSASLLVLSYPNFNFSFLIWVALVPLLVLLDGRNPKAAFAWAWFTGFLFFLGTHYWIIHATLPGMFLFNAYLAMYFGLFGLGYSLLQSIAFRHQIWALASLWVALELVRDRFLTGFGWACLGHSQYQVLPVIQIADVTGVFGVSFVIVMVNVSIKALFMRQKNRVSPCLLRKEELTLFLTCVVCLGILVLGYGFCHLKKFAANNDTVFSVTVVQPNIPQSRDRVLMNPDRVEERLFRLTQEALKRGVDPILSSKGSAPNEKRGVDPIFVWPESAVPNGLWNSPERYERMKELVSKYHFQLLFGAVTHRDGRYFNSAILLSPDGGEKFSDKRHLVPFGEFLPLRPWSNFIEHYVPIGDFTRGAKGVLFEALAAPGAKFGVLICFEDTVAPVVRESVLAGATWLVNITNDGWFQDSNEPHLHLASSVLQAVAHRRPIVRSANTGVSSQIDADGRTRILEKNGKSVMVQGTMTAFVRPQTAVALYTRYGDVFAYFCVALVFLALIKRKKLL